MPRKPLVLIRIAAWVGVLLLIGCAAPQSIGPGKDGGIGGTGAHEE